MILKAAVLAAYALAIIVFGWLGLRKVRSFNDYFLGGRSIGPIMSAFTYAAAYFSAVLFIGFAGKIGWGFGLSGLWIALGNTIVGVAGVWLLLGNRVRRMSVELGVATMPEFLEKRYGSRFLKLLAAAAVFVFLIPYSAAVFIGLAYLFKSNFGLDFGPALLIMGAFTAVYLVLGGYRSMTMVDVFFGMIMCLGCVVLLGSTAAKGGGLGGLVAGLRAVDPRLAGPVGPGGAWALFSLVFLTSVAPFGMPQLVQKFYAIKDARAVRRGLVASSLFAALIAGTAYFTGATARLFISPEATPDAFAGGQPVFDAIMPEFLAGVIPPSLSVLMLLLILSASMSTLAALVLISASSAVKDLYAGFVNPRAGDRRLTAFMRAASALFIVLSVALAWLRPATIVSILAVSWGAVGAFFLGPFIGGLFWPKATALGATASALLGLGSCLALWLSGTPPPQAGTIGMLVSLAAGRVFSLGRLKGGVRGGGGADPA